MRKKLLIIGIAISLVLSISGCGANYYKIKDLNSDTIYFTSDLDREKGGSIILIDANTGNEVTLQNSEIQKINKEEFKANTPKK